MAGKFLTMDEAAAQLGISAEHLKELTQKYEVNGLRDGASFKYKPEEIERAKAKLFPGKSASLSDSGEIGELPIDLDDSGDDIVLLSEVELGESGSGTSATVIGAPGGRGAQEGSDVAIFAKEDSDLKLGVEPGRKPASDIKLAGESDLQLDLGSALGLGSPAKKAGASDIHLSSPDDDDELVLQSPSSSDITLSPGDSGISLASPADSGLSLDEPLNLGPGSDKDFELGGDDLLTLEEEPGAGVPDEEFLLQPSEETAEEDSDSSGSQVIVIDSDSADFTDGGLLEEEPAETMEPAAVGTGDALGGAAALQPAIPMARESQYSGLQIVSLSFCLMFLCLGGLMAVDITRNMWGWSGETAINSTIMDAILGLLG